MCVCVCGYIRVCVWIWSCKADCHGFAWVESEAAESLPGGLGHRRWRYGFGQAVPVSCALVWLMLTSILSMCHHRLQWELSILYPNARTCVSSYVHNTHSVTSCE